MTQPLNKIEQLKREARALYWEVADIERPRTIDEAIGRVVALTRKQALEEAVKLSDEIEMREPDGGIEQWKAFKAFRNTLRDRMEGL